MAYANSHHEHPSFTPSSHPLATMRSISNHTMGRSPEDNLMNTKKVITITAVTILALAALGGGIALAQSTQPGWGGMMGGYTPNDTTGYGGMMGGYGNGAGGYGGMMGGNGA